ncbi:hypothetical protein CesoFtcFv8_013448 [Champsocephalus esox]|uniref:Uncharacterized protein n=1 Tax=Champsocephalus esox TaxID=159716 RepID=A0AAN8BR21_9TELE|nr:hypothetical protein CesoFtcFv8_013448 [Champsocephalus esox]
MFCRRSFWKRGGVRRIRGGGISTDRITSGQKDRVHLAVTLRCRLFSVVSHSAKDAASEDTICRPPRRKRPMSDPPLTLR